jgi:hypothetical protein
MDDRQSQILEVYNEATICLIGHLLMPFSADTFDKESREVATNYGWIIVSLTLANIVVNQLAMAVSVYQKVK